MSRIKVLIADDHRAVAESLMLSLSQWFDVIGFVLTLDELARRLKHDPAQIVVLDLSFRGANALEWLPLLRQVSPTSRFVVFTASHERVLVDAAIRAGALGFVIKESSTNELQAAIHAAMNGESYISPAVRSASRLPLGGRRIIGGTTPRPTEYQMEVLLLLHRGMTQKEAALQLGIDRKTVEYHVREAGKRLGLRGAPMLIRWYEEQLGRQRE